MLRVDEPVMNGHNLRMRLLPELGIFSTRLFPRLCELAISELNLFNEITGRMVRTNSVVVTVVSTSVTRISQNEGPCPMASQVVILSP